MQPAKRDRPRETLAPLGELLSSRQIAKSLIDNTIRTEVQA